MVTQPQFIRTMLLSWFALILLVAIILVGVAVRGALSYPADGGFIQRIEFLLHVFPGGYIPVNPQAPDIRLQYLGTRQVGRDTYDVRVHRIR